MTQLNTKVLKAEDNMICYETIFSVFGATVKAQIEMHDEHELIEYFLN